MGVEDPAAPPGVSGGLFDGGEVQELAAVVAGDGFQAVEEAAAGAFEPVEFANHGLLGSGGYFADDLAPGHALRHDQEARRGCPRPAGDGVHLPVPVLAPVSGLLRTFRDGPAPGVRVGHARAGLFAPLPGRLVGELPPGHAEKPGINRVVDRPPARHPRQAAALLQLYDRGVRREFFPQEQVRDRGGHARGQPRAWPLVSRL